MSGLPLGLLFAGELHALSELLNATAVNRYD